MSIYQDHIDPNNPLYYAPPHTRERQDEERDSQRETPITKFANERMPYDAFLEQAVADALRHPLDPVFLDPPPDLDESRFDILLGLTGRVTVALAVIACVAGFLTFVIPGSRNLPAAEQWLSALWPSSGARSATDESKIALATDAAATAKTSRLSDVSPEQAEKLLQQFVQWQQKPSASTSGQVR
jgi:hypothetical protein